ncbi:MAG: fasciclin domain-containing protein, partial [Verrucomicrobia bacterium]|nr:fasciclin domain-containing protein [Cytophagales bacterium]
RVGLQTALQNTSPLTVLAPTNTAFAGVNVAALTDAQLTSILQYHVIGGTQPQYLKDLNALTANTNVATLLTGKSVIINRPGTVRINGSTNVTAADQLAINGVVHKIDKVLVIP